MANEERADRMTVLTKVLAVLRKLPTHERLAVLALAAEAEGHKLTKAGA